MWWAWILNHQSRVYIVSALREGGQKMPIIYAQHTIWANVEAIVCKDVICQLCWGLVNILNQQPRGIYCLFTYQESMPRVPNPTRKTWNFHIYLSMPGKCLEFALKGEKPGILVENLGKLDFFFDFVIQDVIYKTKSDLHLCHIYIININTLSKSNWPGISLLLPGNNLENTWNFLSPEKWEPCMPNSATTNMHPFWHFPV